MAKRKRLLLIAPLFFGYYKEIMNELEILGFEVDYICDAPSNSNISKALGRVNKNLIKKSTVKYFNQTVLPSIKDKNYSCVLIVAGMTFSFLPEMIEKIKELNKSAKFIMYQWDSEKNLPFVKELHPLIDSVYSFDRYDCLNNKIYSFLPLFYTRIYEQIGDNQNVDMKYDCSYVGTAHPSKYRDINKMSDSLNGVLPKQFIYHYMPSKLKYLYHKLTAPEYKGAKLSDFKTEKIKPDKMIEIFSSSRCILDAPQAGQTGLTIRTLECLGAKRKLVTTNADIKNYDFYSETNILVFDGSINPDSPFFTQPYVQLANDVYKKYSLLSWLKTMLADFLEEAAV